MKEFNLPPNIVVVQDLWLNEEERKALGKLGNVKYYDNISKTPEEWLERCKNADIIYTGRFGLVQKVYDLENKFIVLPLVGVGFLDVQKLNARNIKVTKCPGCNSEAVSERIIAMMLNLFRELPGYINKLELRKEKPGFAKGLPGKNIIILGKGNIGSRVGKISEALGMSVKYFKRGDDLVDSIKDADIVVDVLSLNESTIGLLDKDFFYAFKKGPYFISVTSTKIYDIDAMLEVLDKDILAGAANDCGAIFLGDVKDPLYQKLAKHPKMLTTPHIAHYTDVTDRNANKTMIENIQAYLKGKPINLVE